MVSGQGGVWRPYPLDLPSATTWLALDLLFLGTGQERRCPEASQLPGAALLAEGQFLLRRHLAVPQLCATAPAGDAMVPLADIFNHKASVVELGEGYEVHGADDSSDDGDSEQEDGDEDDEGDADSSGEEDGGGGSGSDSEGEAAEAGQAMDGRRRKQHRHEPGGGCCGDPEHEQDHHGHGEHEHDEQRGQRNGHEPAAAEGAAAAAGAGGGVGSLPAVMSGGTARIYGIESGERQGGRAAGGAGLRIRWTPSLLWTNCCRSVSGLKAGGRGAPWRPPAVQLLHFAGTAACAHATHPLPPLLQPTGCTCGCRWALWTEMKRRWR